MPGSAASMRTSVEGAEDPAVGIAGIDASNAAGSDRRRRRRPRRHLGALARGRPDGGRARCATSSMACWRSGGRKTNAASRPDLTRPSTF